MKKHTSTLNLLESLNKVKAKSFRKFVLLPLSQTSLRSLLKLLGTANGLSLGRFDRLKERIRVSNNFIIFVLKLKKHHGAEFTIKWLKSCSVALQKAVGGDPMKSLRTLEPAMPLPRLINGFPAYINKSDRKLIRQGHAGVTRFWLTQFNIYRILLGPFKTKVNSIYDPFTGSSEKLLDYLYRSSGSYVVFNKGVKDWPKMRAPFGLVLSHKSSPSTSMSYKGILGDFYLMSKSHIYSNLTDYLDCLKNSRYPLRRFEKVLDSLSALVDSTLAEKLSFPFKRGLQGDGLSQLSLKKEAAGKVRVFAIIDSITQSALKPLHDFLFDILRSLPNDGTFDQQESIKRSSEKWEKYGIAFSFDLSSATDRLPARLTSKIIESLTQVPGLGDAWYKLLVDRDFRFSNSVRKEFPHLLIDQDNAYRYSVGQPMGGLSSWAGLAITHHWILQTCSPQVTTWEDRYEILGDDIVIFNQELADRYLEVMADLGVEINLTKSISSSPHGFEFAKRTFMKGVNVSAISLQQIASQSGISSRVVDAINWTKTGLVRTITHLGTLISGKPKATSFRKLNEVGLGVLNALSVLNSMNLIQRRVVIESLINPRIEDFDWEEARFDLPLRSSLKYILDVCSGLHPDYPFSKESERSEIWEELEPYMVDSMLQEALAKAKRLSRDFDSLTGKGASQLVHGVPSRVLKAQLEGFFQELAMDFSSFDPGNFVDKIEGVLYLHAKNRMCSYGDAEKLLDEVDREIFNYTFKTEMSRVSYEKITSPVLTALRKSQGLVRIPYWQHGSI